MLYICSYISYVDRILRQKSKFLKNARLDNREDRDKVDILFPRDS